MSINGRGERMEMLRNDFLEEMNRREREFEMTQLLRQKELEKSIVGIRFYASTYDGCDPYDFTATSCDDGGREMLDFYSYLLGRIHEELSGVPEVSIDGGNDLVFIVDYMFPESIEAAKISDSDLKKMVREARAKIQGLTKADIEASYEVIYGGNY